MGWEERMAERAHHRAQVSAAADEAARRAADPHGYHHSHLDGTVVVCSCGAFFGITCVAFGEDYDPAKLSCSICGEAGVTALGGE